MMCVGFSRSMGEDLLPGLGLYALLVLGLRVPGSVDDSVPSPCRV